MSRTHFGCQLLGFRFTGIYGSQNLIRHRYWIHLSDGIQRTTSGGFRFDRTELFFTEYEVTRSLLKLVILEDSGPYLF